MILHEILPGQLYQRGHMEQFPLERKMSVLREHNVTLVVGLFKRPDPVLPSTIRYIHKELPDGLHIDTEAYSRLAERVSGHIKRTKSAALVHCYGGRNRSGLLSALVVMRLLGVDGARAVQIVKAGRPGSLANSTFTDYLEKL